MRTLAVCVLACASVEKYVDQIRAIQKTWGKEAQGLGVRVLLFSGEARGPADLYGSDGGELVHLPGVMDDYESASVKQWRGLEYIHLHIDADFVFVCGSDTYMLPANMLEFLQAHDPSAASYIGGHGCHRSVNGQRVYFHSGGGGFILSRAALGVLSPRLVEAHGAFKAALLSDESFLFTACDVAMGWFAVLDNLTTVKIDDRFYHCNHLGLPCHSALPPDPRTMLTCHLMNPSDMYEFSRNRRAAA